MSSAVKVHDWRHSSAFSGLIDALLPSVLAAASLQLAYFSKSIEVITKADETPVTVADRESEAILLATLVAIAPDIPIVAEEAMAGGAIVDKPGDCFFLVDPLDGTREFISGRGEFTINIALVRRGRPVFGLIYAPVSGDLYVTLSSDEAVHARLTPDANPTHLSDLSLTPVKAREAGSRGLVAMISRSHMNKATEAFLATLDIAERRAAGSSLKFCLVAAGEADVYPRVGPTSEWDIAAGHAILSAAGGRLVGMDGAALDYGKAGERYRNPSYVAWGRRPGEGRTRS